MKQRHAIRIALGDELTLSKRELVTAEAFDGIQLRTDSSKARGTQPRLESHEYRAQSLSVPIDNIDTEKCVSSTDILIGIEREEFFLEYQPQFALSDGHLRLTGVEALIRWQHPELGLLAPSRFLNMAASTGSMCELGSYVFLHAAKQIRDWLDSLDWSPRVSINVAAEQLNPTHLTSELFPTLRAFDVSARHLEIEIVETTAIRNLDCTIQSLEMLRSAGATIAIDDFGTGFSTFAHLLQLPIDSIKICPTFTRGIGWEVGVDQVCLAIIQLGRSLRKRVVAEGVETLDQFAFMKEHLCDAVQGFFLARPASSEVLTSFLCELEPDEDLLCIPSY